MKRIQISALTLLLVAVLSLPNNIFANNSLEYNDIEVRIDVDQFDLGSIETFSCDFDQTNLLEFKDCTVSISGDTYDLEITFHDVSWWDCVKLKTGVWWYELWN